MSAISFTEILNQRKRVRGRGNVCDNNSSRNFLYDPVKRQGVLCDFGLAEVANPPTQVTRPNYR